MNLKLIYVFLLLIALFQNANAKTRTLLNMKTDNGKGFYYVFKIKVDDNSGKLTDFVIHKNQESDNTTVEEQSFNSNQISNGIVILKKKGHNIVKISSGDFDYFSGGKIKVTYLKNALTKNHESFSMDLIQEGNEWMFARENRIATKKINHKINELFFESEKVILVGTVGIKNVILK